MVGEICSIAIGCGEEVTMFGGVVEGNYGGDETEFSCNCFDIGVGYGFRRVRVVGLSGVGPHPLS
jgi:hypothetical protein